MVTQGVFLVASIRKEIDGNRLQDDVLDQSVVSATLETPIEVKRLRKIEIQNLNGNIIELTLWDEMAEHFAQADIEKMEQPVMISVSSCRVSKYKGTEPNIRKLPQSSSANSHMKTLSKKSLGIDSN
ncbi:nucleic acid-binding, OB-fold protein [Tanacetum coccineum]